MTRNILLAMVIAMAAPALSSCPCKSTESTEFHGTHELDCSNLGLTEMPTQCFHEKVSVLDLNHNHLTRLIAPDFADLVELRHLNLDVNDVHEMEEHVFQDNPLLEFFSIKENKNLQIPKKAFHTLHNIKELHFAYSPIGELPDLKDQANLEYLDAGECIISHLDRPTFAHVSGTWRTTVYLDGNNLKDVAAGVFLPLPDQSVFFLDDSVQLWAQSEEEKLQVMEEQWILSNDLLSKIKVCFADGIPEDNAVCG
ncbi:toll-like receptor 2 type-1 [Oratosquilla oratoria]|uniref:toll-like receptor 2 type-1 n=1 Tax=Oratosquilla oratoria TaxID=337810 RepID=UPI003F7585C0